MGLPITRITEENILEQVTNLSNQLIREEFDGTFSMDLINLYNTILNLNDVNILFNPDIHCLMILTKKIYNVEGCSYIKEMVEELEKKLIRFSMLEQKGDVIGTYNKILKNTAVAERCLPTDRDNFQLPEKGKFMPLTIRRPDSNGKTHIREVLIDCEGYVVDEFQSYYEEDNDESVDNVLYNAFHTDLLEIKDKYVRTDDIVDAEKNCYGEEQYSTK